MSKTIGRHRLTSLNLMTYSTRESSLIEIKHRKNPNVCLLLSWTSRKKTKKVCKLNKQNKIFLNFCFFNKKYFSRPKPLHFPLFYRPQRLPDLRSGVYSGYHATQFLAPDQPLISQSAHENCHVVEIIIFKIETFFITREKLI